MFKKISIKNRIALLYSISFSGLMLLIFSVLYAVVSLSISASVRNILKEEIQHHVNYVKKQPVSAFLKTLIEAFRNQRCRFCKSNASHWVRDF
ncbi:hypothetical protein QW060_22880 [Myroides ceti]|uniref:Uncharacterized protein n=1 Tax=Paenimyroides ceti TaxID=395087 RepID=A0ABT8CZ00_9FLAO|nr:hypothetical protein [Paenimyroides ceti]MDN3709790.1 hypothetical protein [Paenimyroides ceti]